ncbi:MAG TPA: helix-turn-helix domain-containing protein [Blastocatellia bacterium]|jgi:excisionase family DNA binding protein|nr:helix-turn-helix domain-containing protein [Blastocatellia bacterium]
MKKEEMLDTVTAGQLLGISKQQVQRLVTAGTIKATQYGRSWLIPRAEVERYVKERKSAGRPPVKKEN